MAHFDDIYKSNKDVDKVYSRVNEMFNLGIDEQIEHLNCRFESLHEIIDLVNQTKYYSLTIDNKDLNFQDRSGLFEVLIKFIDNKIANIPTELEELEKERKSRDFDDYRHFYDTEALSEKEGILVNTRKILLKEYRKITN